MLKKFFRACRPSTREFRTASGELTRAIFLTVKTSPSTTAAGISIKGISILQPIRFGFGQTLVVPASVSGYPVRGARLYFDFGCKTDGDCPAIVYLDGRRIAMGDDLEPINLTDHAEPGQTFHLAVKVMRTRREKHKVPSSFLLQWPANKITPSDFFVEISSAVALLPTLTTDKPLLMKQFAMLESALGTLDLKALDAGDEVKFDASLQSARQVIEPLRPVLQKLDVRLIGNSHIDTAWLWPVSETEDVVHRTFLTALQLMPEYPNYKYTQSVALYSAWMQEKYPDAFQTMVERTKEGRWEPLGGMWVEPDLNMPDGESLVRQLLIGKTYFRTQMGVDVKIGWNPDSFGYNWQLPQIYKKSGIDYFVTQKMDWNQTNILPLKIFYWQSPDGSRVLTYFPRGYNRPPDPVLMAQNLAFGREHTPGENELMHLYGVGDHGGGPTRVMLDQAEHWMQPDRIYPKVQFSTATEFFADIAPRVQVPASVQPWNYRVLEAGTPELPPAPDGKMNIPVWNDELYLEIHRAVTTTQAEHKKNMRRLRSRC